MDNFIDRAIAYFHPRAGLKRELARMALDEARNFNAASQGRRTNSMGGAYGDANTTNATSLPILRRRARDLVRNNPYAFQAIDGIVTNTVGEGIKMSATMSDKKSKKLIRYKKAWKAWAQKKECDFNGKLNFYGLQALIMRNVAESGECLVVKRRVNSREYKTVPIKLQVIEADYFDSSRDTAKSGNSNYVEDGIEYNGSGKRVAYWLFKSHPGARFADYTPSERVSVDDVLHIYRVLRPGQNRGIPFGVSSFLRLNDLDTYEDAQLTKQIGAACYAAFIQDANGDALPSNGSAGGKKDKPITRLEPGVITTLPAGKTITFATPPAPEGYDIYTKNILRSIAAGYGVTYEIISGDLSNQSFSSGRMGWIELHRRVTDWQQNILIPQFCDDVVEWFNTSLELVTGADFSDVDIDWTAPRREMINVVDETEALIAQIRAGLITFGDALRELGYNPDDHIEDMDTWFKILKEKNFTLDSDPNNTPKPEKKPKAPKPATV